MRQTKPVNHESGQAMVETLVAALALVPLLLVLPHIGKALDIKGKAFESARYGLNERFLFRENAASSVSQVKSSAAINSEASARVQSEPGTRISSNSQSTQPENALWKNSEGKNLLSGSGIQLGVSMGADGILRGAATELLYVGQWTGFSSLMREFDLPQLDMNRQGKAVVSTSYSLTNLPGMPNTGLASGVTESSSLGSIVSFNDTLVGFTGSWMPDSESDFNERLDSLVLDKGLGLVTDIGCLGGLSFAGLLKEAEYCVKNRLSSDTRVIPDRYLDKANKRGLTQ